MNILRTNGMIYLSLLQFLVNHSEIVVYDPEPVFRAFLEDFMSKNCKYNEERNC